MKNVGVILFILVQSSMAYGMVYRWTDTRNITHYTNREYEIPARYREKAKALYPEQADLQQNTQQVNQPPAPVQQVRPATIIPPAPVQHAPPPEENHSNPPPVQSRKRSRPQQQAVPTSNLTDNESLKERYQKSLQGKGRHRY